MAIPFPSPQLIEDMMRRMAPQQRISVQQVVPVDVDSSASILAALSQGHEGPHPLGHFGLQVSYTAGGQPLQRKMVLKSKPHGRELNQLILALARGCSPELGQAYAPFMDCTGFGHSHRREGEIYQKLHDPALMPVIYGVQHDEAAGAYLILMEYLEEVDLLNSVMQPEAWTDPTIRAALTQLAHWHAQHLMAVQGVDMRLWSDRPSRGYMQRLRPLWQALLDHHAQRYPEHFGAGRVALLRGFIADIPSYWTELGRMPQTLVHNDFNPRNLCFRPDGQLVAYDWELATFHVPQYDVVEFLAFVLDRDRYHRRAEYLAYYHQALQNLTGQFGDWAAFRRGFDLAARDFGLHRLALYLMAHTVNPSPFLPRVVESYFATLET